MKETRVVMVIISLFIATGLIVFYFNIFFDSTFNFYRSELTISGTSIEEKLYFAPDKDYHTLFRTFDSPVYFKEGSNVSDYVGIKNVDCKTGQAYFKDSHNRLFRFPESENKNDILYTERNEYGCTFGKDFGFKKGDDYWVKSNYELHARNLFFIKNNYYLKFVVYSGDNHKFLSNKNFYVNGEVVTKKIFIPSDQVIIYIPYDGDTSGYNIINKGNFEFDNTFFKSFFILFICLSPGMLFFILWLLFGRELTYADIPEELSIFPHENENKSFWRKGWEVAAYFNPPFSVTDNNFFSTLLLDFYHKKILDLNMIDKELFVKINKHNIALDSVQSGFLEILSGINERVPDKHKKGEYFNLKKALSSFEVSNWASLKFRSLAKEVSEKGKNYLSKKASYFIYPILIITLLLAKLIVVQHVLLLIYLVISIIFIFIINSGSAILVSFKKDFYKEYQHWQSFKKYLSGSFAMKNDDHKAVVLWDHYLIYSTALGVSKKVISQLKKWGTIDDSQYNLYMGVHTFSTSFSLSSGSSGTGGGFGGAGGGGVGGGGGGGR